MARAYLTELAREQSSYVISMTFVDEDGVLITPTALNWSLFDSDGALVNSRDEVTAVPASSVDLLLVGDDLANDKDYTVDREVVIKATYDSNLGNGLPLVSTIWFKVCPVTGED